MTPGPTHRTPPAAAPRGGRRASGLAVPALVLLLALAPSVGSLGAPEISDDAAALGYVAREGPWGDWTRPQYGLSIVRFWRPAITTTLGLQEAWTGPRTAPLRAFNLAGHALAALLALLCARRLGAGALGQAAAGALAATFPEQGGTVTWIVGRVDSQTVPLALAALWCALSDRRAARLAAAPAAFLACASKEVAFALPALGACLAGARAWGLRPPSGARTAAVARAALPLLLGALAAFAARRAALGTWVGGYPAPPLGAAGLARALAAAAGALALPLGAGALALAAAGRPRGAGFGGRAAAWRAAGLAALAALCATAPLWPLLQEGALEPQNRRVLYLADALAAVAAGAALRPAGARAAVLAALVLAPAVGWRAARAAADVREWTAAAELAEAREADVRAALAGDAPSELPVLALGLPRLHEGAYCTAWGAADRFRPPFPATPRPAWPSRVMFHQERPGERERASAFEPRRGLVRPFGGSARRAPELLVRIDGAEPPEPLAPLAVTIEIARGGGPVLEVLPPFASAALEAVVYTELGYEVAPLAPFEPGRARLVPLAEVLRARGLATLGDALLQAADAGATRAFLELRAVDPAAGPEGVPAAASRWIPLAWSPGLPAELARAAAGG